MISVGDVYKNKRSGRLATVTYTGEITGVYFITFHDTDTMYGLTKKQLEDRWDKQ